MDLMRPPLIRTSPVNQRRAGSVDYARTANQQIARHGPGPPIFTLGAASGRAAVFGPAVSGIGSMPASIIDVEENFDRQHDIRARTVRKS